MKRESLPLEYFVDALRENRAVTLSRWGDGEMAVLLGDSGKNCDGHEYFPELRDDFRRILHRARPYLYGFLTVAFRVGRERIEQYFSNGNVGAVRWVDGDIFLVSSCSGALYPFIAELRKKRTVVVGPPHLRLLSTNGVFDYVDFIETPTTNAYLQKLQIEKALWRSIHENRPELVAFSSGFLTKVIIDDFYPYYPGVSLIDFGSLWDIYCGKVSRGHNRKGPWDRLIPMNLGKGSSL